MERLEENSFKKTKLTNSTDEDNYISQYFTDEFKEEGKGICGLVVNAFKQTDNGSFSQIEETLFHVDMTYF